MWVRRVGWDGENGEARLLWLSLSIGDEEKVARILVRVGACADELRLMGVIREEVLANWDITGGGWDFDARNVSSANVPPVVERICNGPWGDGAN